MKTLSDIDSAILIITNIIKNAAIDSSISSHTTYNNNTLPEYLTQLIAEKRRAKNRWQRSHLPSDKRSYNNITYSLKNLFRKHNTEQYHTYINSLTNSNNSLRKSIKRILNHKNVALLIRYLDRTFAKTNLEKANLFASHLENNFTPHPDTKNTDHTFYTENPLTNTFPKFLPIKYTSPFEIQYIIKNLPNKNH